VMMSIAAAKHTPFAPSDAWCETLEWIDGNTPETIVGNYILAWWDYGYWIERMAGRKAYIAPSQDQVRITEVANGLLSSAWDNPPGDYLILNHSTVYNFRRAIKIWSGKENVDFNSALMVRLYNGEKVEGWNLVYKSRQEVDGVSDVQVFKYKIGMLNGEIK